MSANQNRREFMRKSVLGMLWGVPVALLSSRTFLRQTAAQALEATAADAKPSALPMLDEKDPTAVALGYKADAKKVDLKKFPKRAGAEGAKQFCNSCMFFQATGDPKTAKSAPCQLFAGKQVSAQGWCNSWSQNPKLKS